MPYQSATTADFRRLLAALPHDVQVLATAAFERFLADPFDPSLAFKQLQGKSLLYSARVSLHYRVLSRREGSQFRWFWIGTHAEYDRLIRRLR